jgi:type III restriction enzyme
LPTSTDRFYPDFVAVLNDGRLFAIEYKGDHIATSDDSKEKDNIGKLWEEKSNGTCLFLMVYKEDSQGRNVYKQIKDKIQK